METKSSKWIFPLALGAAIGVGTGITRSVTDVHGMLWGMLAGASASALVGTTVAWLANFLVQRAKSSPPAEGS